MYYNVSAQRTGGNKTKAPAQASLTVEKPAEMPVVQDVTDRGNLEQLGQQITNRVNNWINNYNGYFDNYNTRFGNRKGDLTDSYVSDSQQWLDNATKQAEAFAAEAGEIKSTLNQYGKYFNPEWASKITKALDEAMAQGEQVLNVARQDNEYWSSWSNTVIDHAQELEDMENLYDELVATGALRNEYKANADYLSKDQKARAARLEAALEPYGSLDRLEVAIKEQRKFIEENPDWKTANSAEYGYRKAQQDQAFAAKHAGKSGAELVKLINFIDDENEKDWVTSEALRTLSFDEAAKDLEVQKNELKELVEIGQLTNAAESRLAVDEKQVAAACKRRDEIYAKYNITSYDELRNMITRNAQLIAESKHVQAYVRMSSVQENKDFDKYAKVGKAEAEEYAEKNNKTEHMNNTEIKVLAYYIAKDREDGTDLAEQYKQTIKHYLKHRRAGEIADSINGIDIPVIEGVTRIGYGLGTGVVDWAMDTAQWFSSEKLDPTVMQIANSYIGSDPELNWVDRTLHRAATTTGNMLPSILISKGLGSAGAPASLAKAAGSMAQFTSAAGSAYGNALDQGYSKANARAYSNLVGVSEVTLQNLLGGISEFGGLPAKLDGKIAAIDNALLKGAAKYGVSFVGEFVEEELQNFLEPAFRTIIFGEEYDMPAVQELIDTALTTFITTGALEGPGITSETIKEHRHNNALETATNPVKSAQPPQNLPELKFTDTEIQSIQSIGRKSVNSFTEQDAAATEKLAQRHWEELGEKSPFYRAKNGDWRETEQTAVQIATKQDATRGVQKNADTGWDIQVSGKVFNETRMHTAPANKAAQAYLPYINDIVKNAVLLDSCAIDTGKTKSPNSLLMHSMYAVADIGKGPEVLKLYVEEMNDPNKSTTVKRVYQLQNIEKQQLNAKGSGKSPSPVISTAAINNVADLFAAVKAKDAAFQPKTAQKTANRNVGWDGREVVKEATGPKVTVDGKTYVLLGYDENGSKVYQDAEVLKEQAETEAKQTDGGKTAVTEEKQKSIENSEDRDTIKLPDIQIGRSLGAKAKNYQIMDLSTGEMFNLVEGTNLQNVEVFAGKGVKTPYHNAHKYADTYGGKIEDWQHVKGNGWIAYTDGDRYAEIHWSQCEGIGKHDLFIKRWKDES